MNRIIRFLAHKAYWTTAAIAHICAKVSLAWSQFYIPDRPGIWGE